MVYGAGFLKVSGGSCVAVLYLRVAMIRLKGGLSLIYPLNLDVSAGWQLSGKTILFRKEG